MPAIVFNCQADEHVPDADLDRQSDNDPFREIGSGNGRTLGRTINDSDRLRRLDPMFKRRAQVVHCRQRLDERGAMAAVTTDRSGERNTVIRRISSSCVTPIVGMRTAGVVTSTDTGQTA